jgi:molybdopterin molybdotransferase
MPAGADAVVPLEDAAREGDAVVVRVTPRPGASVRKRGEEARRGDVLLAKGCRLGPAGIGVAAMVGKKAVRVHPWPRVAVLCTGAELRDVGESVGPEQLRDSNGPTLVAALAAQGIADVVRAILPDDPRAIVDSLRIALNARDLVILSGGVSVGRYDFVAEAVRQSGGKVRFHGVRIKPGKPTLYATLSGNRHVFGLPGNPLSLLAGFYEFALPAVRRLGGTPATECRPTSRRRLVAPVRAKGERTSLVLVRRVETPDGPAAAPVASAGSADLVAACQADGMIVVPAGSGELPAGEMVEFHAWK